MSTLCFDAQNLDSAVKEVMKSALSKGVTQILEIGARHQIPADSYNDVRDHIMSIVFKRYQQAWSNGEVDLGCIEGIVYTPVGYVFELAPDEIHPSPPTPAGQGAVAKYTHQAYFWAVL